MNMDPEIEEIIKKQIEKLPIEVRNIIADPGFSEKVLNVGKKNGLNAEQLGTFQLEVNLVMLGLVHPDDFPSVLEENLKVDDIKLDNIVSDVNNQVFRNVKEKLYEVYENIDEEIDNEESVTGNLGWEKNIDFILSGGNN